MKSRTHLNKQWSTIWILGLMAVLFSAPAMAQDSGDDRRRGPQTVQTPQAPVELIYARPFEVEKSMDFFVDGKKSKVKKGWILILEADLELLEPKNAPDFVLFAGDAIAQRINSGYKDGHIVVVVPQCDLEKTSLWFGSRLLPDRIDASTLRREQRLARGAGIAPFSKKIVTKACQVGGDEVQKAKDLNELWYLQAKWIIKYAPAESDMARSLRPGRS